MNLEPQAEPSPAAAAQSPGELPPASAWVRVRDRDDVAVLPMLDGDFLEQALHLSPAQLEVSSGGLRLDVALRPG